MIPPHPALPDGHWWACERPEAPTEPLVTHYRPRCSRCYPAWRAAAALPRHTFIVDGKVKALHPGHSEDEIRSWFMEGVKVG